MDDLAKLKETLESPFNACCYRESCKSLLSAHASALARVAVLERALGEMLDQYGSKYDHEMRRKEPPELEVIEAARAALRTEGEGQAAILRAKEQGNGDE